MTTIKKMTIILITLILVVGVIGCQNPTIIEEEEETETTTTTVNETTNNDEPTYITYKFNSNFFIEDLNISWTVNGVEEPFKVYNNQEIIKKVTSDDIVTNIHLPAVPKGFELKNLGNNEYLVDFTTELVTITNNNSSSFTYSNNNNLDIFDDEGRFITNSTFTIESGENTIRIESSKLSLININRYDLGMELTHYNIEKLSDTSYNIYEFTDFIKLVLTDVEGSSGAFVAFQVDSIDGTIDYYYKTYDTGVPHNSSFTVDEINNADAMYNLTEEEINNHKINISNNEYLRYIYTYAGNIDKVTANIQIYYMDRLWKEIPKGSDYDYINNGNSGIIYFQDILEGTPYLIQ